MYYSYSELPWERWRYVTIEAFKELSSPPQRLHIQFLIFFMSNNFKGPNNHALQHTKTITWVVKACNRNLSRSISKAVRGTCSIVSGRYSKSAIGTARSHLKLVDHRRSRPFPASYVIVVCIIRQAVIFIDWSRLRGGYLEELAARIKVS